MCEGYERYKNEIGSSDDNSIVEEIGYLKSFEGDFNYHLIEEEIKTKISIAMSEINKRGIELKKN